MFCISSSRNADDESVGRTHPSTQEITVNKIPKTLLVALVAAVVSLFAFAGVAQAAPPKCPNGSTPAHNAEYPSTEMSLSAQESGLWEGNHGEYANGTAKYDVYTDKEGYFFFMKEYVFAATEFHEAFSYKMDAPLCGKELPGPPHEEEHHEPPPHEKEKEIVKEKEVVNEKEVIRETPSSSEATACSYAIVACSSASSASASIVVNVPGSAPPSCEQIMPGSVCKPSPPAPAPETCEQSKTCKQPPPHHHPAKCVDHRGLVKLRKDSRIAPAHGHITIRLVGPGTRYLHHVHLHIDQAAYGSTMNHAPFVWVIPVEQFASPQGRLYGNHGVKATGAFKCSKWHEEKQVFSNDPPGHIRK